MIRKIRLTKKIKKIGTFLEEFFLPTMRKYRYHQLLVAVLGRDICGNEALKDTLSQPGWVRKQSDYAERLACMFSKETQSTHFGEQVQIGIEGSTVQCSVYKATGTAKPPTEQPAGPKTTGLDDDSDSDDDSQTTGPQTTAIEDDTNDETDTQEDLDSLPHLSLDLEENFVCHSHISDEKRQDARTTFAKCNPSNTRPQRQGNTASWNDLG